ASRLIAITREHGSITTARARAALSGFFVWALGCGLCEANPVVGTLKPADSQSRERVLDDAELAAVLRACRDDDYGHIVRLLVLLGARRSEVGGMRWSEIDLDRGDWMLPASRSKNKRAHTLPMLAAALAVIKAVPRMAGRDWLFGMRGDG